MNENGPKQDIDEGDELPPASELSLEAQQKKIESTFGKSLKCFARWGIIGATMGGFFVSTKVAEYMVQDSAWKQYISSTLSPKEIARKESNDARIEKLFGEDAVIDIMFADCYALFERQDDRGKPHLKAPERQTENPDQEWSRTKIFFDSAEEYKLCPKGWINGEIDVVQYVDELGKPIPETMMPKRGELKTENMLYLYRMPISPYGESARRMRFMWTIYHELGHANDWDADMDSNFLQRQDLLLAAHDRMTSPDAFSRRDSHYYHDGGIQYHEKFMDETKKKRYRRAVSEYWADICAGYFSDPIDFRKRFPADFDLVAAQVQINDPSFDVFDKRRIDFHHLP